MDKYDIRPAWRIHDRDLEGAAIEFWKRHGLMPPGVDPQTRAKELCAVAYDGDELVGVATVAIGVLPAVKHKFAAYRCAVAPDHRGEEIAVHLTRYCKKLLEQWASDHPEEGVMGMTTVLEGYKAARTREPVWPATGLTLMGYTSEGHQVRIVWFRHARLQ
jgi:hypothetical protein